MFALEMTPEVSGSEDLSALPDARAEEAFIELQRAIEQLQVERLRRLADLERRRIHEREGHLSITAWLVARFTMGWGQAKRLALQARALSQMPLVGSALAAEEISTSALELLVRAREVDPEAFATSEGVLLEAARRHTIPELHKALGHWRSLAEAERYPDPGLRQRARRALHACVLLDGMVRLDGDLTPEVGESFLVALHAVMDAEAHTGGGDDRSVPQRRHDAFGVIRRSFPDRSDRPSVAGGHPHLNVMVGLEDLKESSGTAEADHVGAISLEVVRQIACDASVRRIVLGPGSEPLDVGRATQVVPSAIRRAVIVRDHHCRFPGCDRPPGWCDVHHVVHWADGGQTSVPNLVLMCRPHHGIVHARGGCSLGMEEGHPVFRRADGSVLEDRGPPGR
jgi:hypothetical protein